MDFWAHRRGDTLTASDGESSAVFSKLPIGPLFHVEVKQPRNGGFHRLYWMLCQRIGNAVGAEAETVSDLLKVRTGHVNVVMTKHGVQKFPASISFAKMDETNFRKFFDKCVVVICEDFGMARPDVLLAVEDLIMPTEVRG